MDYSLDYDPLSTPVPTGSATDPADSSRATGRRLSIPGPRAAERRGRVPAWTRCHREPSVGVPCRNSFNYNRSAEAAALSQKVGEII